MPPRTKKERRQQKNAARGVRRVDEIFVSMMSMIRLAGRVDAAQRLTYGVPSASMSAVIR